MSHFLEYFAIFIVQTQHRLYDRSLQVAVRPELCMETCEICLTNYYQLSLVAYLNFALLFIKFCQGIGQKHK